MIRRLDLVRMVPPLVLIAFSIAAIVLSARYGPRGGLMPGLVGWALLVLSLIDLVASSGTRFGAAVTRVLTGGVAGEAPGTGEAGSPRRAIIAVAWLCALMGAVYVFGFLLTIPVYVFLFMVVQGGRPIREAVIVAVVTTCFIWGVFEQLMQYEVYPGLLFARY